MPRVSPRRRPSAGQVAAVLGLLLVLIAVRFVNLDRQDGYLDEGCHIHRALSAWDLEHHPARSAHGKLLLYLWLGLFLSREQGPEMLVVARAAVAGFAIVTGLTTYLLGRRLAGHGVGVTAMALYAVLPLAVFFDRMALADPFASGLAALAMLAALAFVAQPTLMRASGTGALMGLAAMAKLSVAPLVVAPFLMAFTRPPREHGGEGPLPQDPVRRFALPLLLMVGVAALVWLPVLVPAARAATSGDPFVLYHPDNVNLQPGAAARPSLARVVEYLWGVLPLLADFTSWPFLAAAGGAVVVGLAPGFLTPAGRRAFDVLLWWLVLTGLPICLFATLITARYAVVLVVPSCLLLALIGWTAWHRWPRWPVRAALAAAVSMWLCWHVATFCRTMLTAPLELPFSGTNRVENIDGYFLSDDAVRAAAATLRRIAPPHSAATWKAFHLIFYHLDQEPLLLRRDQPVTDLRRAIAELPRGRWLYLAISDYPPFYEGWDDTEHEVIAVFERARIRRPIRLVRLRQAVQ